MGLWTFISNNSGALTVIVNAAMLVVWLSYLHLLFLNFRMENRPNILINRGGGSDAKSRCIVSNMSSSPVYLQAVMLEVASAGRSWGRIVSDIDSLDDESSATTSMEQPAQGPLHPGSFLDIGSFARLVQRLVDMCDEPEAPQSVAQLDELKITLFALYTGRSKMVGATRTFRIESKGKVIRILPTKPIADQISGRSERRALLQKFQEH